MEHLSASVAFVRKFDAYKMLPAAERQALTEAHEGELHMVGLYWTECFGEQPAGAEMYDRCDAAYTLLGLRDLRQLQTCLMVDDATVSLLCTVAVDVAREITRVVDFSGDYDFGVFCYEALGIEPGELIHRVYHASPWNRTTVARVVRDFAVERGWPLKAQ